MQAAPLEGLGVPGFGGLGVLDFFGLGVLGFGFRALGLGLQGHFQFKESDMQGCKVRVQGLSSEFGSSGLGFRGLGFRVEASTPNPAKP